MMAIAGQESSQFLLHDYVTFCANVDLSYEVSTVEYLDELMQYSKLSELLCYLIFYHYFSFGN
jgi:hypothetical protein